MGLEADLKSRTFSVEVRTDNKGGRLRAGMLARVTVPLTRYRRQLLVPRHAVVEQERGPVVYVVEGDRAVSRPVRLGVGTNGQVQVVEGLKEGEWVVVAGQRKLTPNEPVQMRRLNAADNQSRPRQ